MTAPRLLRSALYVPGDKPRALEKAAGLAADAIIFDLEDAVAPDAKPAARAAVAQALATRDYGRRLRVVRINGLDTPWGADDVAAVARMRCDAVAVPKAESAAGVIALADAVAAAHADAGAHDTLQLWCMIETPRGVLAAASIAAAHPRVTALVAGTNDLSKELKVRQTPDRLALLHSLSAMVLAARAAGIAALDGVHPDVKDPVGFAASCAQGRALGFDGKTLIHPDSIAEANRAFAPDADAVATARRVVAAWDEAAAAGKGVCVVDGQLVERLHADAARDLLAYAAAAAEAAQG